MKEKIPFKKDILFKTTIGEITDISLSHDYSIKEDLIEGVFYLAGKYKMTSASVIEEEFFYNIPFSIAISERIDKSTINVTIDSFDYNIKKDVLSLKMNLNMEFENKEETTIEREESKDVEVENINEITNIEEYEEDIKIDNDLKDNEVEIKSNDFNNNVVENSIIEDINIVNEKNEITNIETENILDFSKNYIDDNYITYKVVMMRENDSIESILTKYNITLEDLKMLNDLDDVNINKLIVPVLNNE